MVFVSDLEDERFSPRSLGREMPWVNRTVEQLLGLYAVARTIHEDMRAGFVAELSDGTVVSGVSQCLFLHSAAVVSWFSITYFAPDSDSSQSIDSRHIVRLEKVDPAP